MKQAYTFHHTNYYHTLKSQIGGGIHVYAGTRQRGGGIGNVLSFVSKYAIPLINRYILPHAKEALVRTASDVAENRSTIKQSLKANSKNLLKNIGSDVFKNLTQGGLGKGRNEKL
jgi:hypothetical protein